jgi:hypothetical protein
MPQWTDISTIALIGIAMTILTVGVIILMRVLSGSETINPLRPYALQILGLTFILPVLLVLGSVGKLNSEAVSALMGAMVAFIFGNIPPGSRDNGNNLPLRQTTQDTLRA